MDKGSLRRHNQREAEALGGRFIQQSGETPKA